MNLSVTEQTQNMTETSMDGMEQIIDYIYDHYDHFRLLLKCGDSGKYEAFIHNMVEREIKSGDIYIEKMRAIGINVPQISESLIHMIYTGFFSSVFQIIEHDIDRETAKENVHQLREFNTGGWERLWGIQFPAENHAMPECDTLEKEKINCRLDSHMGRSEEIRLHVECYSGNCKRSVQNHSIFYDSRTVSFIIHDLLAQSNFCSTFQYQEVLL